MLIQYGFYIALGYLSGSLMFGYAVPKLIKGIDVRKESSDGNPGTANAFLCGGALCGILVLLGDILKGILPVYMAGKHLGTEFMGFALIMAAPVFGHAFPLSGGKKNGGKGIAVSFGVLIGLYPFLTNLWLLIFWYLLFSVVIRINPHSYRTLITYICWTVSALICKVAPVLCIGNMLISFVIVDKHSADLKNRKERQICFGIRRANK